MTSEEINLKIETEEDFINYPRFNNSLKALMAKYPNGVKNNDIIAKALNSTPDEVEEIFQGAVKKLKKIMKVGDNG